MAICSTHPALGRIVNALGLGMCRGFTLKADVDSVVMLQAEQYTTGDQVEGVAAALETKDYVLVPREEYDRLAALDATAGPTSVEVPPAPQSRPAETQAMTRGGAA